MTDTTQDQQQNDYQPKLPAPIRAGQQMLAIIPSTFDECWRVATVAFKGRMVPKDCDSIENAMVRIMHGLEVGLPPMAALQSIAVINGRPTIWGDAAIALIRVSGKMRYLKEFEVMRDNVLTAVCETHRDGDPEPIERTWSVEDERIAGLTNKDIHKAYPKRMRQMRARAFCLRDVYADILKGLGIKEEVEDYIEHDPNEIVREHQSPKRTVPVPPEPPAALAKPAQAPMAAQVMQAERERPDPVRVSQTIEQMRPQHELRDEQLTGVGLGAARTEPQPRDDDPATDDDGGEGEFEPPATDVDAVMDWLNSDDAAPPAAQPPVPAGPPAPPPPPAPQPQPIPNKPPTPDTPRARRQHAVGLTGAEKTWLDTLHAAYTGCTDIASLTAVSAAQMNPHKGSVSKPAWSAASTLTVEFITKLTTGGK